MLRWGARALSPAEHLESHAPIDVLPDRSADSLAAWLQAQLVLSYGLYFF